MFSMLDWKIWLKNLNDASHNNHKVNKKNYSPVFKVKLQIASVNEDVEKLEPLCIAGLGQMVQLLWKHFGSSSRS